MRVMNTSRSSTSTAGDGERLFTPGAYDELTAT
jgi:hypothetical protein